MMRQWLKTLRIQKKLWLFQLVTAFASGLVAAAIMILTVWTIEKDQARHNLAIKAAIVADNILPSLQFRDPLVASDVLRGLERDKDILTARVVEHNGRIFAAFMPMQRDVSERLASPDLIFASVPLMQGGERVGAVELVGDMDSVHDKTTIYSMAVGAAMLVSLLVGSLLMGYFHRSITVPLIMLARLMKQISERSDYSHRAEVTSHDELGELENSFNHMIEQIQLRETALNHELVERERAENRLEYLAHHDPVTDLPNRHYFRLAAARLAREQDAATGGLALLFIDLDNFKYVNDTFGHDCGDQLLIAVAQRLKGSVRANDLVVRFGGDEFVVLLQCIRDNANALQLAEKLREALTQPLELNHNEFVVTCSIGVAVAASRESTAEELLKHADAAMYHAKSAGKNGVRLWDTSMSTQSSTRFTMELDLRHAIERQQLEVHYQPIVNLSTRQTVGMEALLRWNHPVHGYISPTDFIPVAEESGLIMEVGEWVMQEAFNQVARWNQMFGPLFVAVNVSARQFRSPTFVARTEAIARASGLARERIELELTESMVMGQTSEAIRIMHQLEACGFALSLDDFGTGYSSLSYLKRFPLDKLKIDRSFVIDLPEDAEGIAIAESIAGLAGTLGMRVVAEGIETPEQALLLTGLACQYGQGYYFSRPLPADRFEEFIIRSRSAAVTAAA